MEKFPIRKYKKVEFIDAGPHGDPGDRMLEIVSLETGKILNALYFKEADPTSLNKTIERAKEWVDDPVNQETTTFEGIKQFVHRYSDEDLQFFKGIVEKKLDAAKKELEYLQGLISKKEAPDKQPAEPDEIEIDQLTQMAERQNVFIGHLEAALVRIENKTYGICRITGKLIDKARLTAVPHATLSVEAKNKVTGNKPPAAVKEPKPKKEKVKTKPKIEPEVKERTCRVCGCTQNNCQQCVEKTGSPCHWVEEDLCSACQEQPEVKVTDERASANSPHTNDDGSMNFFRRLQALGHTDLTMRVMEEKGKLHVEFYPASAMKLKPLVIAGTAEEFDDGFFSSIVTQLDEVKGLTSNIADVKESASVLTGQPKNLPRKSIKRVKPGPKKFTGKKPAAKKPAVKPGPKKNNKPTGKKPEPKPKPKEPRLSAPELAKEVVEETTHAAEGKESTE